MFFFLLLGFPMKTTYANYSHALLNTFVAKKHFFKKRFSKFEYRIIYTISFCERIFYCFYQKSITCILSRLVSIVLKTASAGITTSIFILFRILVREQITPYIKYSRLRVLYSIHFGRAQYSILSYPLHLFFLIRTSHFQLSLGCS